MNKPKIKLALVDDNTMFRKTLQNYLSTQEYLRVCLETSDCTTLRESDVAQIDILVLDVCMAKLSPIEAVKFVRERNPCIRVLILSVGLDLNLISQLLKLGIYGYIHKSEDPGELVKAIHCANSDQIYKNKILTDALYLYEKQTIHSYQKRSKRAFNEREKKILELLWAEKTNKEIADEIYLSVRSVEKIRQEMKDKLEVNTTIGLLKFGLENGIIYARSKG